MSTESAEEPTFGTVSLQAFLKVRYGYELSKNQTILEEAHQEYILLCWLLCISVLKLGKKQLLRNFLATGLM
jgi:hypothetical protein